MKIFLKDIAQIEWLNDAILRKDWGRSFLGLGNNFYFLFDYNLIESESSIEVVSYQTLYEVNDGIYRNMRAEHIGYFKEPFDSTNYLFYSLLKSACNTEEVEKLNDLFISYMYNDIEENKRNLKQNLKANQPITSRISFSNALNKIFSINQKPIAGLSMVFDLIEQYFLKKTGNSFYGHHLTAFVRAVKNPNGGLIPELSNSTMRYLIVGEKAGKDDPKLQEAKDLLRSGNNPKNIYLQTGWYYNKFDNKWRKRISDDTFLVDIDKITKTETQEFYLPKDYDYKNFVKLSYDFAGDRTTMLKASLNGYSAKLGDYIKFDEAYKYYPELKDVLSLYSVNVVEGDTYRFYFNPSIPNSLILLSSTQDGFTSERIKYIALHEIQHYIQEVEGFSNGGNENLALLVDAVGGSSIRSFYIALNNFQKRFIEVASFIPIQEYQDLIRRLKEREYKDYTIRYKSRFINASAYVSLIYRSFEKLVEKQDEINEKASDISYYIVTVYSMVEETNSDIEKFVEKYVGEDYLDVFKQALHQNRKAVERETALAQKGWTAQDLYILNFQTYESVMGEVEARFTQQTTKIPVALKDYFEFYTSETINPNKVAVISNRILSEEKDYEAALETKDGKYIIHLPEAYSNTINILHETGHILYDLVPEVITDIDATQKAIENDYKSLEEYFCACFVDYIHRKNIDPMLTKDLDENRDVLNYTDFDNLFDNMLYGVSQVNEEELAKRLEFVSKLM